MINVSSFQVGLRKRGDRHEFLYVYFLGVIVMEGIANFI